MADTAGSRQGASAWVFKSLAEHDRADAEYWAALPADVRVMQVWKLSLEQWKLQGRDAHEPGPSRSIASVRRHDVRFLIVGAYALAIHGRLRGRFGEIETDFIGREAFIRNKLATGRAKDRVDVESLS